MQKLLAQMRRHLAETADEGRLERLAVILAAIERARAERPDLTLPLSYRAAIKAASDVLVEVYGGEALDRAREIEKRLPRTFARVVTRRLERLGRDAGRVA